MEVDGNVQALLVAYIIWDTKKKTTNQPTTKNTSIFVFLTHFACGVKTPESRYDKSEMTKRPSDLYGV